MFNTPEGQKILKFSSIVLILLAVFLGIQSIYTLLAAGQLEDNVYQDQITVTGKGEILAVPDVATFSFGAQTVSESVASAQQVVTQRINKAIDILKAAGIDEKDIKTTSYYINPHYQYKPCTQYSCPSSNGTLTGYDVSQTVEVKVRDTSKAGELLTKLGGAEITNLSGLTFTVDDVEKIQAEARSKAIIDAREKAKKLAKDLDVDLGDIVSFYDNYCDGYCGESPMYAKNMSLEMSGMGGDIPQIPVGENKFVSNVSIVYQVNN